MKKKNIGFIVAIVVILVIAGGFFVPKFLNKNDNAENVSNSTDVSQNKFTFVELPIEMILPEGYTMKESDGQEWRASFSSYSLESHQKQGMQPTIWSIDFFSAASIDKFTKAYCADTTARIDNPCSNGGYPGMKNYLGEKEAFQKLDKVYENAELKKFNDRYYFTSKSRCSGDSCDFYNYTTYIGDTKADVNIISWDPNGKGPADELFQEVKILDKNM